MDVESITVLNDIRERLVALTPAEMEWGARRLTDKVGPKDKVIGEVTNEATRAIHVLAMLLNAESRLEVGLSCAAIDPIKEEEHRQRSVLLDFLSDVAREISWAQSKVDLGHYRATNLGLREGFILVELPKARNGFESLMRLPGMPGSSTDEADE